MDPLKDLSQAALAFERHQNEKELRRRRARRNDHGKLRPQVSRNRELHRMALEIVPVPGQTRGAEIWITYTGMRDTWLALREEPRWLALHTEAELGNLGRVCNPDALNGYVVFPKRRAPAVAAGYDNLVQYIPVHGGITYACKDTFAAVWGFNTGHFGSDREPVTEPFWIKAQAMVLYRGLILAEQLWPEFRRASRERRAELAQQLLDLVPEQPFIDKLGFGAMINTLMGRVG